MKLILFTLILNFFSLVANAQSAFTKVSAEYQDVAGSVSEVPNMPRIRSQDSLGLCQSFAGATLLQKQYCDQEKVSNCSQVSANEEISPLHVWSYISTNKVSQEAGLKENHRHVSIENLAKVFGENVSKVGSVTAFNNMKKDGISLCSEGNFPFDQFANKYGQSEEAMSAILSNLKSTYETQKAKMEAQSTEACDSCLKDTAMALNNVLPKPLTSDTDLKVVKRGLAKDTFGEFLFESFFYKCDKISMKFPDGRVFPAVGNTATKQQLKNKIAEVVKNGYPVGLNSLCVDKSAKDGCGAHELVVSGFKKSCNTAGKCVDQLKVHNSWGQGWQDQYTNNGWVNADDLLNRYEAEPITKQAIVWLQNPN